MQNLGVRTVIAGVKVGIDYFSGKKNNILEFWENGRYWSSRKFNERSNQNKKLVSI